MSSVTLMQCDLENASSSRGTGGLTQTPCLRPRRHQIEGFHKDFPMTCWHMLAIVMVLMSPNFSDFCMILPWLLIRICLLVVLGVTSNVCFSQLFPICWLLYRFWFPVVWFLEAIPQLLHHRLPHASLCAWFYIPTREAGLLGPMNTPVYKADYWNKLFPPNIDKPGFIDPELLIPPF